MWIILLWYWSWQSLKLSVFRPFLVQRRKAGEAGLELRTLKSQLSSVPVHTICVDVAVSSRESTPPGCLVVPLLQVCLMVGSGVTKAAHHVPRAFGLICGVTALTIALPSLSLVCNHPSVHEEQRCCCRSGEYLVPVQPALLPHSELPGKANQTFLPTAGHR